MEFEIKEKFLNLFPFPNELNQRPFKPVWTQHLIITTSIHTKIYNDTTQSTN